MNRASTSEMKATTMPWMRVGRLRFRTLAATLVIALLVQGCATGGMSSPGQTADGPPPTAAEQKLAAQEADYNRTLAEGMAIGAIGGAAVGAGLGAAVTRNRAMGALIGAGIGALVGTVAGGATGSYYAEKKKRYANEEDRLDSMIADAQAYNAKAEASLATTRVMVKEDQQKLATINREVAANRMSQAQAQKELAGIDRRRLLLTNTITSQKQRRDEWRQATAEARRDTGDPKVAQVDQQIAKLEGQIALMEHELEALNSRRATVVG